MGIISTLADIAITHPGSYTEREVLSQLRAGFEMPNTYFGRIKSKVMLYIARYGLTRESFSIESQFNKHSNEGVKLMRDGEDGSYAWRHRSFINHYVRHGLPSTQTQFF